MAVKTILTEPNIRYYVKYPRTVDKVGDEERALTDERYA